MNKLPEGLLLKSGAHKVFEDGACVMEAVAFVAGEPFSDHPACASKVIGAFLRSWNDSLPDDKTRTKLLSPLVPKLIGTAAGVEIETQRAWMAIDWSIRVSVPTWMALTPSLKEHVRKLKALDEIKDKASFEKAEPFLLAADSAAYSAARSAADSAADSAARSAAYSAARSAAYSAALLAAYSAADSAARSAARSAAYSAAYSAARSAADSAAYSAADSAARSAARSAAYSAAYSAARKKLAPTVKKLQASALKLVKRMIECGKESE